MTLSISVGLSKELLDPEQSNNHFSIEKFYDAQFLKFSIETKTLLPFLRE